MKKLLLILLLSLGFVVMGNTDINGYTSFDDEILLKLKNQGFKYTRKCPMGLSKVHTWIECIGRFKEPNENLYWGDINFGKPHGYGKFDFISQGFFYVGEFKNGKFNGQGYFRSLSGNQWGDDGYFTKQGEWKLDELNGQGSVFVSSSNGRLGYVGELKNDKFHGQGKLFLNDEFREGIFEEGVFKYPNNSYILGNSWECDPGYVKSDSSCVKIPLNTYVAGDSFKCLSGYVRNFKLIEEGCIKLPANASSSFFDFGWICDSGYISSGLKCKKKPKSNPIANLFNSNSSKKSNSSSYKSNSSSYKSNSSSYKSNSSLNNYNSPSRFTSTFGNTYQYNLSNPIDRIKYKSDPGAKIRDSIGHQYIRELESITNQFGGGIYSNNTPTWNSFF
jgi:hypothetical protein